MALTQGEIDEIAQCFEQVNTRSREVCAEMDQGAQEHFAPILDFVERRRREIVQQLQAELAATNGG